MIKNPLNRKINILVVPSDRTGVSYFRSTKPHISLENKYPDDFHVDIEYQPELKDDAWLKQYDLVHYHRSLGDYDGVEGLLTRLDNLGIVSFMDVDDHWSPGTHHPAYKLIQQAQLDKKISKNLKTARNVITTTDIFAEEISKLNSNVYVIPNAIDPTEKQYKPNPTKSERLRIGWLGGSCYDDQTEVLTDDGWKYFKDLTHDENVMTLNQETNKIQYQHPVRYISEPYVGKLNVGSNKLINYAVTPNYNMYVSKVDDLTHKKLSYQLVTSETVHGNNLHFKRDGIWDVDEIEHFYITNEDGKETKQFEMDDWLKFFGFWLADGWTSNINYGKQTGICQFKDNDYLKVINTIMVKYGYTPSITKDGNQYRYCNKELWSYLSQFGKANDKFIPRILLNLNSRQLSILLDWYIKGDGSIDSNKYGRKRAWTVSKTLASNLQEIALKIGIAATITNRGKRDTTIKGKSIDSNYDIYQIGFSKHPNDSKHNQLTPLLRDVDQHQIDYDGNVYCVEVPNHILYIRRNGKAFWCGNSHLEDLKLLKGVVNKIKSDGLLDKVQFVLCGYDLRGNVTNIDQKTGQQTQRPILPHESVWYEYEKIFTDNYSIISSDYKNFLHKFTVNGVYDNVDNEPYRRVWTKPITSYASNYNLFDVSLAPLYPHMFNMVKSQLKVIESGFHKKAIIAQDFGPYTIDLKNAKIYGGGFDDTANSLLVDTNKNHKQWYQYIKYLIQNPEKVEVLANNLYETVKNTYSTDTVSDIRRELYMSKLLEKVETVVENV